MMLIVLSSGFLKPLFKGGNERSVFCCCPLKAYGVSNAGLDGHFEQVVFPDGVKHRGEYFIYRIALI